MHRIAYHAPRSVEEAAELLAAWPGRARMLAGGTDLIAQVREDLHDWDVFVDAKHIDELTSISVDESGALTLGAAVPCYRIYGDPRLASSYPALIDSARIIGGIAIQGRASVGGNLCNAGPAGDSIPSLIIHRATCLIAGPEGRRFVPVEAFCTGPGRTVLGAGEMLVSLSFPAPLVGSGAAYLRFTPRDEMDIAVVGTAAYVQVEDGIVRDARVAIGAVAPTARLVTDAADALIGEPFSEQAAERAGHAARTASRPISDMRGTVDHRLQLVGVLLRRALAIANNRAQESRK